MFYFYLRFGVGLIGIQSENETIKLNPGPNHLMKTTDICFFMSNTDEEETSFAFTNIRSDSIPNEEIEMIGNNKIFNNDVKTIRERFFSKFSTLPSAQEQQPFIEKSSKVSFLKSR